MRYAVLLALLVASPALADVKGPGGKTIECYCTDTQGARVELGEVICLFVNGRAFLAQCEMSLNVPIWRDIGEGCVSSQLDQSPAQRLFKLLDPPVEPGGPAATLAASKS